MKFSKKSNRYLTVNANTSQSLKVKIASKSTESSLHGNAAVNLVVTLYVSEGGLRDGSNGRWR